MGDQTFAGPAFTLDEDIAVYRRHLLDEFKNPLHLIAGTHDAGCVRIRDRVAP